MKKILCRIFGHKSVFNFHIWPSKCICSRCKKKWVLEHYNIRGDTWEVVDHFKNETRTDEELIKGWPASGSAIS